MKKYLFYYGTCFNQTFLGALMDEAIHLAKDNNNKVLFAYCGGIKSLCDFNRKGSRPICSGLRHAGSAGRGRRGERGVRADRRKARPHAD